jgi:hypothetical protein
VAHKAGVGRRSRRARVSVVPRELRQRCHGNGAAHVGGGVSNRSDSAHWAPMSLRPPVGACRYRGVIKMPNIGYGSNAKTRHTLPNGFLKYNVSSVADLELLMMHNRCLACAILHLCISLARSFDRQKACMHHHRHQPQAVPTKPVRHARLAVRRL